MLKQRETTRAASSEHTLAPFESLSASFARMYKFHVSNLSKGTSHPVSDAVNDRKKLLREGVVRREHRADRGAYWTRFA